MGKIDVQDKILTENPKRENMEIEANGSAGTRESVVIEVTK